MAERTVPKTISVPEDLHKRMLALKDQPNWSRVASEAFETKLKELERHGSRTMQQFGRDMDIAETLFGWRFTKTNVLKKDDQDFVFIDACEDENKRPRNVSEVPPYTSDTKAMGDVLRAAQKKGIFVAVQKPQVGEERLVRGFRKGETKMVWATADTEKQIPEAVCNVVYRLLTER